MTPEVAKLLAAGIACTGLIGAGIGVGHIFGNYLQGALRNPSAADGQRLWMFVGAAMAELLGLLAFVVAMVLLYAK
jgi:F-type H+-transporting ATPase subunit c